MRNLEKYVGLPFKEFGRDWDGVDCLGIADLYLKNELGLQIPEYLSYANALDREGIDKIVQHAILGGPWMPIERGKELHGDLIVLKIGKWCSHVGVVIECGKMLHIEMGINSVIESYKGVRWKNRIQGFYRLTH